MPRKKGYWPDGKSVIPGMPDNPEYDPHEVALVGQKMGIERVAIGHMNYPGDLRSTFDFETFKGAKGPSYMGEVLFPVDAAYDEETNMTKIGFSLMPPPNWVDDE